MRMNIDESKCQGCGTCVSICPSQTISMVGGKAVIDPRYCMECGTCMVACPYNAISMSKTGPNQGKVAAC